jgi:protoporphyrinogen oxidase
VRATGARPRLLPAGVEPELPRRPIEPPAPGEPDDPGGPVEEPAAPDGPVEHWGIVGGGFLGMTLAHRLAQQGKRVTLIEAADRLGGLASAWRLGDVVWDRHYHVTLLSDAWLRGILRELGLERDMEWKETRTGVYAGGRHHSVSSTVELLRFPVLGPLDKLRLGLTLFYGAHIRDGRRLEKVLVADWLRRWSGRRVLERFWLPLLRSKLGESYRETSAAFIWTTIARLYAARRTGLKKEMFGYVPGGYARVLERYGEVLAGEGVKVELGRQVETVERVERVEAVEQGGARGGEAASDAGTAVRFRGGAAVGFDEGARGSGIEVRFRDGSAARFDQVAVTLAAPLAARLCPGLDADERRRLAGVRYLGIVCASVLLRRPLEGFYVTNILDGGLPFTGVVEMSALVDRRLLGGCSLVYLPRYLVGDDPFFAVGDAEVEDLFLAGLERMYPAFRRADVACFRVSRVRQVLALSTLDYSANLPPMTTSVPGLHLVSSAHVVNGTLNVNETVQLAEGAARRLGAMTGDSDRARAARPAGAAAAAAAAAAGAAAAGAAR